MCKRGETKLGPAYEMEAEIYEEQGKDPIQFTVPAGYARKVHDMAKRLRELEMIDSLKPCPFCGGKAQIHPEHSDVQFLGCAAKDCPGYRACWSFQTHEKKQAIRRWNTRSVTSA